MDGLTDRGMEGQMKTNGWRGTNSERWWKMNRSALLNGWVQRQKGWEEQRDKRTEPKEQTGDQR